MMAPAPPPPPASSSGGGNKRPAAPTGVGVGVGGNNNSGRHSPAAKHPKRHPNNKTKERQCSGGGSSSCNVRVVARIRPLAAYEIDKGCSQVVGAVGGAGGEGRSQRQHQHQQQPPQQLCVDQSGGSPDGAGDTGGGGRWYELDAVFDGNSTQESVYDGSGAREAVCEDLFKGYNCTILAYGQTGSGKTYTMGGSSGEMTGSSEGGGAPSDGGCSGIIPRACADLFAEIRRKCDGNAQVELSYLEVYNEEIRDLLVEGGGSDQKAQPPLRIRENLDGEVYVRGLQSRAVENPADVGRLMDEASGRRVVASTKMNATSSRSHAICALRVNGVLDDSTKFSSKLTLVDLAGSERIKKTGAQGNRAQEGISINKGLFVLGQVVSALAEQRPKMKRKPPYRDSKLTRLLQDSLGGNSRTIMVACVSPADFNAEETINTLRYATSARNIKNTATRNVVETVSPEEAARLRRENDLLKQQVKELESVVEKLTEDLEEAMEGELARAAGLADENGDESPELTPQPDGDDDADGGGLAAFLKGGGPKGPKKSYEELEAENERLKSALHSDMKSIAEQSVAMKSMAESAIELPKMKVKVQMLEDELHETQMIEEEADELRHELEQTKAEAAAARHAADQLSHIVEEQLSQSQRNLTGGGSSGEGEGTGTEMDEQKLEYSNLVTNEEWVNVVAQLFRSFKEELRQLGDLYAMFSTIVDSPTITTMLPPRPKPARRGLWGTGAVDVEKEKLERKREELDLRQKLLSEHIQFFNDKFLETEDGITSRSESLDELQEHVRQQKEELENRLGTGVFMQNMFFGKGEEILLRISSLLEIELNS